MSCKITCPECHKEFELRKDFPEGTPIECMFCNKLFNLMESHKRKNPVIGGYEITLKIADGGMGQVFLARQLSMDREVAFKILSQDITHDKDAVEAFLAEIRSLGKLDHPNIVTAFDSGFDQGIYYLVMSYIDGADMDKRVDKEGRIKEKEVLEIAAQVSKALAYAWDKAQLLHRDIKPGNIIVDEFGTVKLLDFGVAQTLRGGRNTSDFVEGTANYMSPEQATGRPLPDCRSDIYALGATLHHLLSGELPYRGITTDELMNKHTLAPLPPVQSYFPDISNGCSEMIRKMIAPDRENRYQSWPAVTKAIEKLLASGGGSNTAAGPGIKKKTGKKKSISIKKGGPSAGASAPSGPRSQNALPVASADRHVKQKNGGKIAGIIATWAVLIGLGAVGVFQFTKNKSDEDTAQKPEPGGTTPVDVPSVDPQRMTQSPEEAREAQLLERLGRIHPDDKQGDPGVMRHALVQLNDLKKDAAGLSAESKVDEEIARVKRLLDELMRNGEFVEVNERNNRRLIAQAVKKARGDIAKQLLSQDFADLKLTVHRARRDLESLNAIDQIEDLVKPVEKMTLMPNVLLQTFRNDIGKEKSFSLKDGDAVIRIKRISGQDIQGDKILRNGNKVVGSTAVVIKLADLSVTEKFRRLATFNGPEFEVMRGILSYESKKIDTAKSFFRLSNSPLGALLHKFLENGART